MEPGTPATLVRNSTTELPRPIPTVHIAPTFSRTIGQNVTKLVTKHSYGKVNLKC